MPIYEYECPECGHTFEELMRVSDPDPACAECGAEVRKLMSNTSFQLKGSGWYVTDYKDAGNKKKNKSQAAESSPASDAGSGGSSETKPDSSSTKPNAAPTTA